MVQTNFDKVSEACNSISIERLCSKLFIEMSCIQVTTSQLPCARSVFPKQVSEHYKEDKYTYTYFGTKLPKILKLTSNARHQHAATVCLFGGKRKPENGNQVTYCVKYFPLLYVILVLSS